MNKLSLLMQIGYLIEVFLFFFAGFVFKTSFFISITIFAAGMIVSFIVGEMIRIKALTDTLLIPARSLNIIKKLKGGQ